MTASPALPNEFLLVTACCMWPPSPRRDAAIVAAASATIDWPTVRRIVQRQRVEGLVADGLKRAGVAVPPDLTANLARATVEIGRQSLLMASEALRLQAAFDAAEMSALFLKGTTLAILAYGTLGIKHAWDIDLLVAPQDIRGACAILQAAGYVRSMPDLSLDDQRFFEWAEFARECVFRHPHGTFVELHWRLSDNANLLAHVDAHSPSRMVAISPGHAVRTLADDDLFAYLCLHGARHGWSRLKWLADLAAWLSAKPADEIERLYRAAREIGAGRAPAQSLLLCARLFALPLPSSLAAEMSRDRATRWLVAIALSAMAGGGDLQTDDRFFGDLEIRLSHFLLAPGPGHWLHEMRSKSIGWTDFRTVRLPRPLYFLYPLIRIPSWIWRRATHLLGRS